MAKHPMQPLIVAKDGVIRFKENAIIRYLVDKEIINLNDVHRWAAINDWSKEDQMQLAQLMGYSISGYGELDYVTDAGWREAEEKASNLKGRRSVHEVAETDAPTPC